MKSNELMIGDWVQVPCLIDKTEHYDAWCKVRQLRDDDLDVIGFKELKYNEIVPIPLTTEILEKNGFKRELNEDNIHYKFILIYDGIRFSLLYARNVFQWLGPLDFKYVHQLQHALRLCGIEKEIEL